MSASNWDICPGCWQRAQQEFDQTQERLRGAYGVIPLEDFDALRKQVEMGINDEDYRTFREDYEFYIKGRTLYITYSGSCLECGTEVDYNDTKVIPLYGTHHE